MNINRFRFLLVLFLSSVSILTFAVPAKRGQWRTLKLSDGSEVRAELRGDDHAHWWQAADGTCYVAEADADFYKPVDKAQAQASTKRRVAAVKNKALMSKVMKKAASSSTSLFQGEKRGLIILVAFPDQGFYYSNPQSLYNRIANEQGYSDHGFNGSIRDYFIAQSGGQFTLDFDIAGPVMMSHDYSYYGQNNEANAPQMIKEACEGVDSIVNFANYDWDGDGEVEEVFVLYAGHGQADYDSRNDDLIWPHMYYVNPTGYSSNDFYLDNVKIDVYACSSELNGANDIAGIGTFCHEFSHCMGFPDMYDTGKAGNFGKGSWDLMDYGSYNGDGYTPAGYSGYEKMICGWTNPVELTKDTTIAAMQPMSDMGQSYIVYNKGNRNEYYIITNRQKKGYDASLPGHGMIVEHVDYDETVWTYNLVNTTDNTDYARYGITNDHPRMTIFHAGYTETYPGLASDAYPYNGNDSLTNKSWPAATVYNANSDGTTYMNCAIRNITENSDGSMSFDFGLKASAGTDTTTVVPLQKGVLFSETFDKCNGEGGNDGKFEGAMRAGYLTDDVCDNAGWAFDKGFRGDKCARLGSNSVVGGITSPSFTLTGDTATVSFRAACWNGTNDGTSLKVSVQGNNVRLVGNADGQFTMQRGAWSSYSLKITGSGQVTITFTPGRRFFLDDVLVTTKEYSTGIRPAVATKTGKDARIYNLGGQYVGTDLRQLPHGIYIVGGRKIVK